MAEFREEDRDTLVEVRVHVQNLAQKMDKFLEVALSDKGFPRCAERGAVIGELEKKQEKVDSFITWFYRGIALTVLIIVLSEGFAYAKYILKAFTAVLPGEAP